MDYINHITSLRTNKHLSYAERFFIEKSLQANMIKSTIVTVLGRYRTTIYSEIHRGFVIQIKADKENIQVFFAQPYSALCCLETGI